MGGDTGTGTGNLMQQIQSFWYFPSNICAVQAEDFLAITNEVSEEYLKQAKVDLNELYPVRQTKNYAYDDRLEDFNKFIVDAAYYMLKGQGYNIDTIEPKVSDMWTQEHHKHSAMEQHIHSWTTLVGFYFLNAPEMSSRALFHDPRPAKVMTGLAEYNNSEATPASDLINFEAQNGLLLLSNGWLPHSFTRHAADEPLKFAHINIVVNQRQSCSSNAEVV
jgi:uncharacterized protein (TIGR02466 family)